MLAPTNSAFTSEVLSTYNALTSDQKTGILQGHVISGQVLSSALSDGQVVPTVAGISLTVSISGSTV